MCRATTILQGHPPVGLSLGHHQHGGPRHQTFACASTAEYPLVVHVQDELQLLALVERQVSVVCRQPVRKGPHVTNGLHPARRRLLRKVTGSCRLRGGNWRWFSDPENPEK